VIAAALPDGDSRPLLVGFSGGLDSTVLLHLLASSPLRAAGLRAIHVHHGLQADADAWAAHCQDECDALGVPLTIGRVMVADNEGEGREAAARRARHAAFAEALHPGEVLVLAHHRDDQAETFLLRALRASGPDALGAMRSWRRFHDGWLWRPLLGIPRDALLACARAQRLHWIEDPSNDDATLDRNFLRRRVLPVLQERWPGAAAAFARSAALATEAEALLADEDARSLALARSADPNVLGRGPLLALPAARRARVLRCWITELGLPALPGEGIARIESDLLRARDDAEAAFAWSGAWVRCWRGELHAGRQRMPLPQGWSVEWDGRRPLPLPGGGALELSGAAAFDAPLVVHARQGGERITLPGRTHSHALKHVLQDLGVPPWLRARLPLARDPLGALVAAGDLAYSATLDDWLRARGARLRWSD
jgi:tRNA(Ile)-lysidine synthase